MNTTTAYPPIPNGTPVKTTQANTSHREEWTEEGWASKKWDIKGTIVATRRGHGLYYEVKHGDGTVGYYDPSELEVIMPQHYYLLAAKAMWTASCEHPSGKRDMHNEESCALETGFEAPALETARLEAKRRLAEFENSLPKKREGSLSWQDEDAKIVSTTFAMVLEL